MTPLMLAIGTDRPDIGAIRLLLEKGADKNIKSKAGETAVDWAKKFNYPPVLDALGIDHKQWGSGVCAAGRRQQAASPKEAAAKSIALLQAPTGIFPGRRLRVLSRAEIDRLGRVSGRANGIKVTKQRRRRN